MVTSLHDSFEACRSARMAVAQLSQQARSALLQAIAEALRTDAARILEANAQDLQALEVTSPMYDRLALTPERIASMAQSVERLPLAPCDLGKTLEARTLPSGISVQRIAVPLGVVACIYEARPNVTVDIASMCLATGNVALLKGGKEAEQTNRVIVDSLQMVLEQQGLPKACLTLLPSTHEAAEALMTAEGLVDVLIPRGSARLIAAVRHTATVPTIETGAGVCHVYVHEDADVAMAAKIIENAKLRRVSVCNALDCLLVHQSLAGQLDTLLAPCLKRGTQIHWDNYGHEWLSPDLSVKFVDSLEAALHHIAQYGSGHSEAIVTQSESAANQFLAEVDAACVYVNTPTSFTDGAAFGLGAEVGISTQKLHARGPMGLNALLSSKWLIRSNGAVRS